MQADSTFSLPPVSGDIPERLVNVCGVSNAAGAGLQVCKWSMNAVKICVDLDLPGLIRERVLTIFQAGVAHWTEVAQLDVEYVTDPARANILAKIGRPGRQDNFDGPNGVLAWCELPCGRSNEQTQLQMRFDPAEHWVDEELLHHTIWHEIGHGFGLEHTNLKNNIMQPYLNLNQRTLGANDFAGIVGRYGRRSIPVAPPTTTPPPVSPPVIPGSPLPSAEGTLILSGQRYRVIPFP